jgi:hypothetical protein
MISPDLIDTLTSRLTARGFALTEHRSWKQQMGSALWHFSSDILDIEIRSERGTPVITMGPRGRHLYDFEPWAELLGAAMEPPASFDEQVEFILNSIQAAASRVTGDPDIDETLRELNWTLVKSSLGLDPDMPRPGRQGGSPEGDSA